MKIYKPLETLSEINEKKEFIDGLINNNLPLKDKISNLNNAYKDLIVLPNGVNELLKNIFLENKLSLAFPRIGDTNTRFDATFSYINNFLGIVEIEVPSTEMLDAPRNMLDNIAVHSNRYHQDLNKIIPLIICWGLPNNRSDYWNVITDIDKILGIKIRSVTIMALCCYYWTGTPLDFIGNSLFIEKNNNSLSEIIDVLEKKHIDATAYSGLFQPFK